MLRFLADRRSANGESSSILPLPADKSQPPCFALPPSAGLGNTAPSWKQSQPDASPVKRPRHRRRVAVPPIDPAEKLQRTTSASSTGQVAPNADVEVETPPRRKWPAGQLANQTQSPTKLARVDWAETAHEGITDQKDDSLLVGLWCYEDDKEVCHYVISRSESGSLAFEEKDAYVNNFGFLHDDGQWYLAALSNGTIRLRLGSSVKPTVVSQFKPAGCTTWEETITATRQEDSGRQTFIFRAGQISMRCKQNTGTVTSLGAGQARDAGVKAGWRIVEICGQPYTPSLLREKVTGCKCYGVTFSYEDRSVSPSFSTEPENHGEQALDQKWEQADDTCFPKAAGERVAEAEPADGDATLASAGHADLRPIVASETCYGGEVQCLGKQDNESLHKRRPLRQTRREYQEAIARVGRSVIVSRNEWNDSDDQSEARQELYAKRKQMTGKLLKARRRRKNGFFTAWPPPSLSKSTRPGESQVQRQKPDASVGMFDALACDSALIGLHGTISCVPGRGLLKRRRSPSPERDMCVAEETLGPEHVG